MAWDDTTQAPPTFGTDDPLGGLSTILGDAKALSDRLPQIIQQTTNQLAMLRYQNQDIEGGRWTLNNLVAQYNQLSPFGQAVWGAGIAYVVVVVIGKVAK